MKVQQIMSPAATVAGDERLDQVAAKMLRRNASCVVVLDAQGDPLGILTERDFTAHEPANPFQRYRPVTLFGRNVRQQGLTNIYEDAPSITAARAARPFATTLLSDDSVERAVDAMNRHDVLNLPVFEDERLVGVLTRRDLLRLAAAKVPPVRSNRVSARARRPTAVRSWRGQEWLEAP